MRCSKCGNEIPAAAFRCPNCALAKPKSTRDLKEQDRKKSVKGHRSKARSPRPKWVNALACIVALTLTGWIGYSLYAYLTERPHELDPHLAQPALAKLRQEPSGVSGLNVDEYLAQKLEKSRRVGNLLKYQGWTVSPVKGSKTKLLIAFSYEERDNTQYRAEWIADVANNTFIPQTELAVAAYKR